MSAITCPNCNHVLFNLDTNLPGQSAGATSSPPAAAPSSPAQCKHGPMFYKAGTNKQGKSYAGWFCSEDDCKPVWVAA